MKKYLVPASIGIVTGVIFAMAKAYLTDEIVDSWIKVPPFEIMNQPFLSLRMRDLAIQAFALRFSDTLLKSVCGISSCVLLDYFDRPTCFWSDHLLNSCLP